jgi:hypothetical protein
VRLSCELPPGWKVCPLARMSRVSWGWVSPGSRMAGPGWVELGKQGNIRDPGPCVGCGA